MTPGRVRRSRPTTAWGRLVGALLVGLAVPATSANIGPAAASAIEHCVSSRFGYTCFAAVQHGGAAIGKLASRTVLATASVVMGREVFRDMREAARVFRAEGADALLAPPPVAAAVVPPAVEEEAAALGELYDFGPSF